MGKLRVETFSTCAPSNKGNQQDYLDRVVDVARWSDRQGYRGILVYTDNSLVDPWLVAQEIELCSGSQSSCSRSAGSQGRIAMGRFLGALAEDGPR